MVVKSWNRLKRNGCMDAWMHGAFESCSHAVMQSCNSPNTPSGIPGRLTSYKKTNKSPDPVSQSSLRIASNSHNGEFPYKYCISGKLFFACHEITLFNFIVSG
jgi:hypothetical protein